MSYDTNGKTDVSVSPALVTLTLPTPARDVKTYLPFQSANASSDQASASTVALSVPDHPLIVEITQ